ncbi:hypothetical protein SAMN05446927_0146 [Caballeronia arationis]|uniref:Uncharacterized protein n=1 Tax=Caballeronia arationis TaxID=1777142 RepID=A0A7Z7I3A5_9BURK|nr:hypothetical protein SAMN05446927_0146 [Caballeronia arationis]
MLRIRTRALRMRVLDVLHRYSMWVLAMEDAAVPMREVSENALFAKLEIF